MVWRSQQNVPVDPESTLIIRGIQNEWFTQWTFGSGLRMKYVIFTENRLNFFRGEVEVSGSVTTPHGVTPSNDIRWAGVGNSSDISISAVKDSGQGLRISVDNAGTDQWYINYEIKKIDAPYLHNVSATAELELAISGLPMGVTIFGLGNGVHVIKPDNHTIVGPPNPQESWVKNAYYAGGYALNAFLIFSMNGGRVGTTLTAFTYRYIKFSRYWTTGYGNGISFGVAWQGGATRLMYSVTDTAFWGNYLGILDTYLNHSLEGDLTHTQNGATHIYPVKISWRRFPKSLRGLWGNY